ncbi:carboxypeptidase regulatory-like domain-containing protein [Candidatus Bathyarchaeota archaeon]|nr:carboxypeptidase regulatory-like domain-containing protein [Candidatus Bathyarchaeota archaeon]
MRKLVFVFLVSSLLLTLTFVQKGNIPAVKASSSIHQGDLILTGNNVTVIEGRFDINGSIIVEENATLILKNAIINFTQTKNNEHSMSFRNPLNGNPRLQAENTTITASNYYFNVGFWGNSTGIVYKLETASKFQLLSHDSSVLSMSNINTYTVYGWDSSVINISDSTINAHTWAVDSSTLTVSNSTIGSLYAGRSSVVNLLDSNVYFLKIASASVNCSIIGLEPGLFSTWDYRLDCSVFVGSGGYAPIVTVQNSQIGGWYFDFGALSNATISNSTFRYLRTADYSVTTTSNSIITEGLYARHYSKTWLVNSTIYGFYDIHEEGKVYVNWYLGVYVVDSIGQDVLSANVTVTYPNAIVAESKLTDANGWARLTLMEKMVNATGDYTVGNYTVEATYEIYSDQTTVNMTENQQITLTLEDFIIPEFPSFLILPLFMIITLLIVIAYRRKDSM